MKIGIHLALWMNTWNDDILPYASKASEIGYDGVELSLLGDVNTNAQKVGNEIRSMGLEITCATGLAPETDIAALDETPRKAGIRTMKEAIATTSQLGADQLAGVIYAAWGVTDWENRKERLKWSADSLFEISKTAEQYEVHLGLEAINRYESDLLNTAEQALELTRQIDSPWFGVHLDSYHMNIEEKDPASAILACGSLLKHYHVVDNDRGVPGTGKIDFPSQAEALRKIDYEGWITCEMFVQACLPVSPDLNIWRPIESDPDTAAVSALNNIKRLFNG